jgi:hypothetical protein
LNPDWRSILPAAWMFASALSGAAETNSPARFDFPSFGIISERNIFDPNRYGRSRSTAPREESTRRVNTETFALLGTMSYEKGRFAFFDGSGSQYRKVLQPAGDIAGFKITEVAPTCVKLEGTNGQVLELCVGMQMRHREDEGWQLAGPVESSSDSGRYSSSSSSSSTTGSLSAGESEEVLKKLMAQREQDGGSTENTAAPPTEEDTQFEGKSSAPADEGDEVLKRLLQKREQDLNK